MRGIAMVALLNGCTCGELEPADDAAAECVVPMTPDCGPDAVATYAPNGGCGATPVCTPIGMECPPIDPPGEGCGCCGNQPMYFSQCLYDGMSPFPLTGKLDCFE
jgi:hypothetical protein